MDVRTSIPLTLDLLKLISERLFHLLTTTKSASVDLTPFGNSLINRCRLVCVLVVFAELLDDFDALDWLLAPQPLKTPTNVTNAKPLIKLRFHISLAAFLCPSLA